MFGSALLQPARSACVSLSAFSLLLLLLLSLRNYCKFVTSYVMKVNESIFCLRNIVLIMPPIVGDIER